MTSKKNVTLVFLGQVNSGKSTLIGHLCEKLGLFSRNWRAGFKCIEMDEDARIRLEEMKNGPYKFANMVDRLRIEIDMSNTVESSYLKVETNKVVATLINTPGRIEYVKNAITIISQADVAVLVLDSSNGVFFEHTKQFCILAFAFGLKQMIIAVNQMDQYSVDYKESRFDEIRTKMMKFLTRVGYDPNKVPIVPMSGWTGENLTEPIPSRNSLFSSWWKEGKTKWGGMTFLKVIENLKVSSNHRKKRAKKPLRICLMKDIHKISGVGRVAVGRIHSGILKPGMVVEISPGYIKGTVRSIEIHRRSVLEADPGDIVGLNIRRPVYKNQHDNFVKKVSSIRRGFVVGGDEDPPKDTESFEAQILVLDLPGSKGKFIQTGFTPILYCHTARVSCRFEELVAKIDKLDGRCRVENPTKLEKGDCAIVKLKPLKPIVVERYKDYPTLGRFCLRDNRMTVAVGIVKRVVKDWKNLTWSRENHKLFPKRVRKIVRLVLLCSGRDECELSRVSKDIMFFVLFTYINPNWFQTID